MWILTSSDFNSNSDQRDGRLREREGEVAVLREKVTALEARSGKGYT